jgi:GntR family transcriptional regulator, sialic acid-inducible nan operon repressor
MTRLAAGPIRRRKLYEEIVDRLESMMLDGTLKPGEQLPSERELMSTFEVGRPAVREALFALNRIGLVSIQNGERAVVTRPSAAMLLAELSPSIRHMLQVPDGERHFQDVRMLVEVALARRAAARATPADVARLAEALARNEEALGHPDAFVEADMRFHLAIAEISRNPIINAVHGAIATWLREQRATSVGEPNSPESALRAHRRIFTAIRDGDPDGAEKAMRAHLEEVARFYWRAKGRSRKAGAGHGAEGIARA